MDYIFWLIFSIPIMIISATVHEFAHAWVAVKLGDSTPAEEGRLTLNPIAHIDPVGFLFMVIARIGWAKPVPVNVNNFKRPLQGQFLVAIAGPLSNIALMFLGATILKLILVIFVPLHLPAVEIIVQFFMIFIFINATLAFFNLLPIPPLDGGNIVDSLIPESFREQWQSIGKFLPFILLIFVIPGTPFFALFSNFWYNFIENIVSLVFRLFSI